MADKKDWRDYINNNQADDSTNDEKTGSWRDYARDQSTSDWRSYSLINPTNIVSNNALNRVSSLVSKYDDFNSKYQKRYANRKFSYDDAYVADSSSWAISVARRNRELEEERQSVLAYLDENKGYLDPDWVLKVKVALKRGSDVQKQVLEQAEKDKEWWTSFGSNGDLLKEYGTAEGVYNYFQRADGYKKKYDGVTYDERQAAYEALADGEEKDFLDSYRWKSVDSESDFRLYSNQGAAIKNPKIDDSLDYNDWFNSNEYPEVPNIVTFSRENADALAIAYGNGYVTQGDYRYRSMEKEEVDRYNYLLAKYGKEKAGEYLDYLDDYLNQREGKALADRLTGIDIPVIEELALGAYGVGSGVEQWATGVRQLFTDEELPTTVTQYANANIAESLDGLGKYAYQATNVLGNMLPSILLTKGLGAAGLGATATKLAGVSTMGLSAAGNAYADGLGYGMEPWQARIYGTLVGVAEGATEYAIGGIPGISNADDFLSAKIKTIDNTLLRVSSKIGYDVVNEIAEEELMNYLEPLFRSFFTGEYDAPTFEELLETAIITAISTPAMGGVGTVADDIKGGRKALNKYGNKTDSLIQEGLESDVGTQSYKLAKRYQQQVRNGKAMTGNQIRVLLEANQEQVTPKDMKKIQKAAEKRLTDLGQTGDVSRLAELAAKYATGKRLTRAEKYELASSDYGSRVVSELTPKNIESGEYTTDWAEQIGTKSINANAYNKKKIDQVRTIIEQMQQAEDPAQYKSLTERTGTEGRFGVSESGKAVIRATGEEIDTSNLEVKTVGDGKITFKIGDRVVSAGEIDWANDNQSFLVSAVSNIENITPADATAVMRDIVDMEKPLGLQLNGIDEAFTYGFYDYSVEDLKAGEFAKNLTDKQLMSAYELGKAARKDSDTSKVDTFKKMRTAADAIAEKNAAEGKKSTKGKNLTISFNKGNGEVIAIEDDGEDIVIDGIGKLNEKEAGGVKVAQILHKMGLGTRFEFFRSYISDTLKVEVKDKKTGKVTEVAARVFLDENGEEKIAYSGVYRGKDGVIRIDLAAYNGRGLTLNALAHELTHFIQQWSDSKYKVLVDFLMKEYGNTDMTMHERVLAEQKRLEDIRGEEVYYDEAYDEVVANAMNKMFDDGKLVEKLTKLKQQDKNLAQKLWEGFKKILAKFIGFYEKEGLFRDADVLVEMKETFDQLQNMFAEALVEASENYQASLITMEAGLDFVAAEDVSQYSYSSLAEAAGFVAVQNEDGTRSFTRDGKAVVEVTVEDIDNSPIGAFINFSVEMKDISEADAMRQKEMFAKICTMACKTNDFAMTMQFVGSAVFTGMKANADKQYGTTYDFPSICTKTQAVIDAMSAKMKSLGRGLKTDEIVQLYEDVFASGNPVPCPECYVFSRWIGIGGLLDNIKKYQDYYGDMAVEDVAAEYLKMKAEVSKFAEEHGISFGKAKGALTSKLTKEFNKLTEKIEKQENQGENVKQADRNRLAELEPMMNTVKGMTWLENVYFADSSLKKVNPKFRVPNEVLFDLNNGEAFASQYKDAWHFRTTQGAGYGKAITPYAEARLGEGVLVTNNTTNTIKGKAQGSLNNYFLSQMGKLDKQSRAALVKARMNQKKQAFMGGQRLQSTSDARYENASDYLLAALEMQAMGAMAQAYTKVDGAVPAFSAWGISVNQSLMPLSGGLDENGNLQDTPVGGMKPSVAFENRKKHETAGTITIGVNDNHIRAMYGKPERDFIIPYHASGGKADVVDDFRRIQEGKERRNKDKKEETLHSTDYSRTQGDKILSDEVLRWQGKTEAQIQRIHEIRAARIAILTGGKPNMTVVRSNRFLSDLFDKFDKGGEWEGVKLAKNKVESQIFPNEFWDKTVTYEESGKITKDYLEYCNDLGFLHRFSGTVPSNGRLVPAKGYNEKGERVQLTDLAYKYDENGNKTDVVEDFFWQTLTDRRMYDNSGNYLPQKKVTLNDTTAETVTGFAKHNQGRQYDKAKAEALAKKILDNSSAGNENSLTDNQKRGEANDNGRVRKVASEYAGGAEARRAKATDGERDSGNVGGTQTHKKWGDQTSSVRKRLVELVHRHITEAKNRDEILVYLRQAVGISEGETTRELLKKATIQITEELYTDAMTNPILFEFKWSAMGNANRLRDEIISLVKMESVDGEPHSSQKNIDSDGRQITKEQQEFFKDTKVVDKNGRLLVLYHGSSSNFTVFERRPLFNGKNYGEGYYFTEVKNEAHYWGRGGVVYEVYVNLTNPYYASTKMEAPEAIVELVKERYGATYDKRSQDSEWWGSKLAREEYIEQNSRMWNNADIALTEAVDASDIPADIPADARSEEIARRKTEILKSLKYDGVIVTTGKTNRNFHEVVAFDPEQIKLTTNKNPTTDLDIRYSEHASNADLAEMDDTALYIKNTDNANYIGMIFNGAKTEETRTRRTLDAFIGKDFYVTDGKYVYGSIVLGEPHKYTEEEFHKKKNQLKHRVPVGDEYDIKPGGIKWAYPIESYKKFDKPKKLSDSKEYKNSFQARQVRYSSHETDLDTDYIRYDRKALIKESKVDEYLYDYAAKSSPKYAQAYIAYVRPRTFLKMTTEDMLERYHIADQAGELDEERLSNSRPGIYLRIDHETGKVTGHEGRHRMSAMDRAGIELVPVLLLDTSNKMNKTDIAELTLHGQFDETAVGIVRDLIPLNYENRDRVIKNFATQSSTQRIGERYGLNKTLRFSEHDTDYSNRDLLANAFEGLSRNSDEYKMIQEYKGRIRILNEQEEKLSEINYLIRQLTFGDANLDDAMRKKIEGLVKKSTPETSDGDIIPNGTRVKANDRGNIGVVRGYDSNTGQYTVAFRNKSGLSKTVQLSSDTIEPLRSEKPKAEVVRKPGESDKSYYKRLLVAEAEMTSDSINKQDKKLLSMEASGPLHKVIEQERKKEAQKTKAHVKEIVQNKKLRAEQTELRHKIRKAVRDLDKLLNKGNKKINVKEDMKGFVSKTLELADYLFTDHISNDDLIRKGITVRMTPKEAALVKETEKIIAKLDVATDINQPDSSLTDEEFTRLDAKRKANEEKLRDLLTKQRNERLNTPVYNLFNDLVNEYASLKNSSQDSVKAAYDEDLEKSLRAFMSDDERVKILKNMRVADMTSEELNWLYRAYTKVLTNVRNANKFHVKGMTESIDKVVIEITKDFIGRKIPDGTVAIAARNLANKMGWDYEKLYYALDRIGSEAFTQLFTNLANSENIVMDDVIEAALFRDQIVEKYGFNNWDVNKKIDREFLDNTGKKFKLTLGEIMALYAYSRRKGAWDHIKYGGFVFGEAALTNPKPADSYKLSKEQCEAITKLLTKEQKDYVEDMQKFLSETMGEKGNEVSMMLYGIKMFGEKNYFPIKIAGQYMAQANESQAKAAAGFSSMSNAGFTHEQNPNAKAPFVLEGFNEIWADHVNEMSRYHGTVPALEDIRRVMNRSSYSESGSESMSIKQLMENSFGKEAVDYFTNLYREANSGAITDKLQRVPKKLLSLFRKNSVAYKLSVLVQQPTSIIRAYTMISKKYFGLKGFGAITSGIVKAAADKFNWTKAHTNAYNEMLKYAPGVTMAKEIGGFDTATGGSIRSYLLDTKKSFGQKVKTNKHGKAVGFGKALFDKVGDNRIANLPNLADKIAWIEIWNACKRETVATHKDLEVNSEEFMQTVGKRFTEVIRATQVYDSIFAKSPMMKSKNPAVQYLVSFMGEPNTVANLAESALRDAARGNWRRGARKAVVLVYAALAGGLVKSFIYAMDDDDEDETYAEKYVEALVGSLVNDFNPLSYIPVARDVSSALQGYDVERPDMAIIVDAIEALQAKNNLANKNTENMTDEQIAELEKKKDEATWNVVDSLAAFFGIPVKNIRKDVNGIYSTFIKDKPEMETTELSLSHAFDKAFNESKYFFLRDESKTKQDKLYDAIMSGDTVYVDRLKAGYKDEDAYNSAVRKALRENDPRIHEAALAYYNGNLDEYKRIFKKIRNDDKHNIIGYDNTMEAVMSEVSAIKGKLEPKTENSAYNATDFVNAVLVGNADLAQTMKEDIISYKVVHGATREEAEEAFTDSVATSTRNAFDSDLLDEAGTEKMLLEYAGMDEEEAAEKTSYWAFIKAHPQYRGDLSQSNVEKYHEFAEPAEIPLDVFVQYVEGTSGLETIRDEWGDEVKSKREQVLEVIDSLPLTWQQKDALYLAAGYAESKIWDVPW